MSLSVEITKNLLAIKAVQINPHHYFTWTSGIKSPIYCDNRLTMSYPRVRQKITKAFIHMIHQLDEKPDVIAGCATAGIPHAAWLADELNLPLVDVRSSAKGHGKRNQIEGQIEKGQKVLVIEDLISTGGSSIQAATALKSEGLEVINVFAICTYGLSKSSERCSKQEIPFKRIASIDNLIERMINNREIKQKDKEEVLMWRDSFKENGRGWDRTKY